MIHVIQTTQFRTRIDRIHGALVAMLALAAVLLSPIALPIAAAQSPPGGRPPIVIDQEVIDFGIVGPGSLHPATFRLTNSGNEPITIAGAVPSCRCTTMDGIAGQTIAPGATFELKATLEAPTYPGVKESRVTLVFRNFRVPLNVTLRCDVAMSIRVAEEFVDALEDRREGTLTVESRDGKPFRILSSNGEPPVYVGFDPSSDEPQSSYKVRWNVRDWPCEGMRLWWIIETDRADTPILPARIRHECTGARADPQRISRRWMLTEQIVNAGRIKAGETVQLSIAVENSEPKAGANRPQVFNLGFRDILNVTSQTPLATTALRRVEPGGELDATVHFDFTPSAAARGMVYAIVRLSSPNGTADVAVVASVEAP